jgi:hypothetical protein
LSGTSPRIAPGYGSHPRAMSRDRDLMARLRLMALASLGRVEGHATSPVSARRRQRFVRGLRLYRSEQGRATAAFEEGLHVLRL